MHVVLEAGINTPEKEPKVNISGGEQPLLPAKEEDGASKKPTLSEDKFGHEQVKTMVRSLLLCDSGLFSFFPDNLSCGLFSSRD